MRVIAFDTGARRTGVAVSDASGIVARPLRVLHGADVMDQAVRLVAEFDEDERVGAIVVGLPRRLDGSDTDRTPHARAFAETIAQRTGVPVVLQDERLSSVEAESRLAMRERDWRARKATLDAAAAAVVLQDYLDSQPTMPDPDTDAGVGE
jgi:putative Holliday junction resolvase